MQVGYRPPPCIPQASRMEVGNGNKIELSINDNSSVIDNPSVVSDEVALAIFQHLDPQSLLRAGKVCKRFKQLSDDDSLWKKLYLETNGQPAVAHPIVEGAKWKSLFIAQRNLNQMHCKKTETVLSPKRPNTRSALTSSAIMRMALKPFSLTPNEPIFKIQPGEFGPVALPIHNTFLQRIQHNTFDALIKKTALPGTEVTQDVHIGDLNSSDQVLVYDSWAFILDADKSKVTGFALGDIPASFHLEFSEWGSSFQSILCRGNSAVILLKSGTILYLPNLICQNPDKGIDLFELNPSLEIIPNQVQFNDNYVIFMSSDCKVEIVDLKNNDRKILDLRAIPFPAHVLGVPDQISASDFSGELLAVGTKNGKVILVDIPRMSAKAIWEAHLLDVLAVRLAGNVCVTLGDIRALKYWHIDHPLEPYHEELIHAPSDATSKRVVSSIAHLESKNKRAKPVPPDGPSIYFDGRNLSSLAPNGLVRSRDFLPQIKLK